LGTEVKAFSESPFALHCQQPENDKENVNSAPARKNFCGRPWTRWLPGLSPWHLLLVPPLSELYWRGCLTVSLLVIWRQILYFWFPSEGNYLGKTYLQVFYFLQVAFW